MTVFLREFLAKMRIAVPALFLFSFSGLGLD